MDEWMMRRRRGKLLATWTKQFIHWRVKRGDGRSLRKSCEWKDEVEKTNERNKDEIILNKKNNIK